MAQTLQWSLTAQVPGGPKIATTQTIDIEAYDSIKLAIGGGPPDPPVTHVELQPGAAGQVKALIITSDHYSNNLNYRVNEDVDDDEHPLIMLDQPQVFMGEGAVGLLNPAPVSLFFRNTTGKTVAIEILIGRDATFSP